MTQSPLVTNFKNLDSIFSEAVERFQENKQFAYVCSLLILNSNNLIIDPQSQLLYKHFNYDSDLVTILEDLYEISEKESTNFEDSGFNYFTISFIYSQIEKSFDVENGREAVHRAIDLSKSKEDGILGEVNKFINCLNQNFIDQRKIVFKHICNANAESVPSLIYQTKDSQKNINIYKRPGSHGLQSPANVIVLSISEDSANKELYGMIIHKDKTEKNENLGVVSIEIFNNLFFFKIYESCIDDLFTNENFINIYRTKIPNDKISYKVFINNFYEKSFLSYCPRNKAVDEKVRSSISFINSLIPFVPRSILVRNDHLKCTIEIIGYGSCQDYINFIHLDSNKTTNPIAYPINKETLEFAASNIEELKRDCPKVRFAVTGENFFLDSNENEDLSYPNIFPYIKNVFDSNHPSHLILLVDHDYKNKLDVQPLSLIHIEESAEKRRITHLIWNYDESSLPIINNTSYYDQNSTCLFICESKESFLQPLFAYEKDGSVKPLKVCKECFLEIFKSEKEFQNMIDPVTKKIDYEKLNIFEQFIPRLTFIEDHYDDDNNSWPQIPLGQILFTLSNDEELYLYLKLWFTVVARNSIEFSKEFTRCPNHPNVFYEKPKIGDNLKCARCDMMYCDLCHQWHGTSEKCDINYLEIKRCPKCNIPSFKVAGSSRMICTGCGAIWCYRCKVSPIFNTVGECYEHLSKVHHGYL